MKKRIRMLLPLLVAVAVLVSMFVMALPVMAGVDDQADPPGANTPSIGMSLSVRDASTHLPIGDVKVGDVLEFRIQMSVVPVTPPDIAVNFQQGTLALKIGAGSYQHVAGYGDTPITEIPKVSESTPFIVTAPFTYTVNATDIGTGGATAGKIKFYADYGNTGTHPAGVNGWYLFDAPIQDASATNAREVFVNLPFIDVEKYVKDNSAVWQDADSAPGPYIPSSQDPVVFKFALNNTGNVDLIGVNLTDTDMTNFYNDEACMSPASFPTTLNVGQTKTYYGKLTWVVGPHNDIATAEGTTFLGGYVSDTDPANYVGVDARITISPNDTNKVGDSHNFTVFVEKNDGTGWADASGVSVTGSITGVGSITSTNPANTDANGEMIITITSAVPGTSTVDASGTVNVGGINIAVATNGYGAHDIANVKTWVNARISIVESGTNPVNTTHNFTVTVEKNDGTGWVAASGVSVTGSITGVGSITSTNPANTDGSGHMTITITSAVPGTSTVHASGTVNVGGINIAVATNGYGAYIVHNVKEWTGGGLATRTWGFWKTHLDLVQYMYDQGIWSSIDMGTWNNAGNTSQTHVINSTCRYFGLMWSDQSANSNSKPRYPIDVVRIHAAHQALAAIMNSLMPGGAPLPGGLTPASIATALSSNNITVIGNLGSVLENYNVSGDLVALDPSLQPYQGNADPQGGRQVGRGCISYFDTPPQPKH